MVFHLCKDCNQKVNNDNKKHYHLEKNNFYLVIVLRYGPHLELIKAQCEVQDLSELFGKGLLSLQMLCGVIVCLTSECTQQTMQRCLCRITQWSDRLN